MHCGIQDNKDPLILNQLLDEHLDKIVKEVKEVDEFHAIEQSGQLSDYVVKILAKAGCHIAIRHHDAYCVDAATSNHFINAFCLADSLNQELHCLLECVLILREQDISVVPKQQTEAIQQDHCLCIVKLVHSGDPARLLFQEAAHISANHSLKVADEVFALGEYVGDHGAHEHAGLGDQHWVRLEEGVVLPVHDRWLEHLGFLGSLQRQINGTTSQVSNEGNAAFNVVAE